MRFWTLKVFYEQLEDRFESLEFCLFCFQALLDNFLGFKYEKKVQIPFPAKIKIFEVDKFTLSCMNRNYSDSGSKQYLISNRVLHEQKSKRNVNQL